MSSVSGLQIFHKKLKEIGIKGKVTAALKMLVAEGIEFYERSIKSYL